MSADAARALLRAVRDDPDDDLPRLAFADWLDEHDDPDRAEFVRVQVELARLPDDDPARPSLEDREHDLLAANEPAWLGSAADPDGVVEWQFERGFLAEIHARPSWLSDRGADVFAEHPVRRWRVAGSDADMPDDLLRCGRAAWAGRLEVVDLSQWYQWIGELERFLTRSDLARLRSLDVSGLAGLDELPGILGRCSFLPGLRSLRCGGGYGLGYLDTYGLAAVLAAANAPLEDLSAPNALTEDGLRELLVSPAYARLTRLDAADNGMWPDASAGFRRSSARFHRLDVSGNNIWGWLAEGLDDLFLSDALSELRSLAASTNNVYAADGSAVAAAVARSLFWDQAEELRLAGALVNHSADPLFQSLGPPALRTLDVSGNGLGVDGVQALCDAAWAGGLTFLDLSDNMLTDDAVRRVGHSGRFTRLRTLHLGTPGRPVDAPAVDEMVTEVGVMELADCPSLANLRVLTLTMLDCTTMGLDAVLNAPHWRLSGLGLSGCLLEPDAVGVLAKSPRLTRLELLDLSGNPGLGGDALMPLAESEHLCRLTELDVRGVPISAEVRHVLRRRLGRRLSD